MNPPPQPADEYDVVIMGGALSGASTAVVLLQQQPGLRLLVVEKSEAFTRRVGEATVEVSSYFLTRVLGLTRHLNQHHLVKQGLRFWFSNSETSTLAECSEIGGRYLARVPAFLVDRAVLDEEVLRRAEALGADVWRPAVMETTELQPGGRQQVRIRRGSDTLSVSARWLVDASGVAARLARQNDWLRVNPEHPTASAWARWRGVKDLDGPELAAKFPEWRQASFGMRSTATNHLMGPGWWAWIIPLKGDEVSIGVVFDQRLVRWPESGTVGARLKEFLCRHPAGMELLQDATWVDGDVHWRKDLSYSSTTLAGDGFVLVGDAAGFLDPFYSPGMDWVAFTVARAAQLIVSERRGEAVAPLVARHNRDFSRSFQRWFEALYRDKYRYFGEFDLLRIAFLVDLGCYYLGVASQPYRRGDAALLEPVFSTPPSAPVYHLMRLCNRRLARIAVSRQQRGLAGSRNRGRRFMFGGFTFQPSSGGPVLRALAHWGWLEVTEGWRTWFGGAEESAALVGTAEVKPSAPVSAS